MPPRTRRTDWGKADCRRGTKTTRLTHRLQRTSLALRTRPVKSLPRFEIVVLRPLTSRLAATSYSKALRTACQQRLDLHALPEHGQTSHACSRPQPTRRSFLAMPADKMRIGCMHLRVPRIQSTLGLASGRARQQLHWTLLASHWQCRSCSALL